MSEQTARRRPKLEVALEEAGRLLGHLHTVSQQYQQVRQMLATSQPDNEPQVLLTLNVAGSVIPLPLPNDPALRVAYVEEAASYLGQQVVDGWLQLEAVVTEAAAHCKLASAPQASREVPPELCVRTE